MHFYRDGSAIATGLGGQRAGTIVFENNNNARCITHGAAPLKNLIIPVVCAYHPSVYRRSLNHWRKYYFERLNTFEYFFKFKSSVVNAYVFFYAVLILELSLDYQFHCFIYHHTNISCSLASTLGIDIKNNCSSN